MDCYPSSMPDVLLCRAAGPEAGRTAVTDTEGYAESYEGLLERSLAAAAALRSLGVSEGDTVALTPINKGEAVEALYAAWLAGAAAAVIDPLSHSLDLEQQLSLAHAKVLVTHRGLEDKGCPAAEKLGIPCIPAEKLAEQGGRSEDYARPPPWAPAVIYFYAGVAGRTLPVIHTHSSITASAHVVAARYGLGGGDKVLVAAPISHALGLQISLLAALYAGSHAVLYTRRGRLDPAHLASTMASEEPRMVLGAPGMYTALLRAGYRGHRGLDYAISAGAPLPPETAEAWEKATGSQLLQLYGLTEAAPVSSTLPGDNPPGSVGKPFPGIEVKLRRIESVEEGGELLVRGPVAMKGYGDEKETAKAILPGGWLRTGDIAVIDGEGHIYIKGVLKRMIKYKGYPVFPRDLEAILEQHPAVERAEVYGEPAGEAGQIPVARVKLRPGAKATPEELMEWVNSRVAPYKRIRRVALLDSQEDWR